MARSFSLTFVALAATLSAGVAAAQDVTTSDAALGANQSERSTRESDPGRNGIDRFIAWSVRATDRANGSRPGLHAELGGLIPGAGVVAAGPGYWRPLFANAARVDISAVMSFTRYTTVRSSIEWPRLMSNRLSLGAEGRYQDFPLVDNFGVGARTPADAPTTYRFTSVDVLGSAAVHPVAWLAAGGRAGYMRSRAAGDDPPLLAATPGLNTTTPFAHVDVFVEVDRRDVPGYPRKGGIYRVGLAAFRDLDGSRQSVVREEMEAAQYLPLFHDNWVLAARARIDLSQALAGQETPFFLLPTLGGESSLRGYADYRFRDHNAALVNLEYRWPLFQAMDAALFVDAGTVAAVSTDLWHGPLRTDYGIGFRVHSGTRSIARIDVARGQEGTRVLVSLRAPIHGPSRLVAPFVP